MPGSFGKGECLHWGGTCIRITEDGGLGGAEAGGLGLEPGEQ